MTNQVEPSTTALGGGAESRKRKKIDDRSTWRSDSDQQIYSNKLLDALRVVNSSNPRNIRAAADRVLAVTAKGKTRWSRSILKHHRRRRFHSSRIFKKVGRKNPNDKFSIGTTSGSTNESRQPLAAVEKRVRVLGRLIPGCGKLSFPNLLEETTDYIAALEMQVRAMASFAQLLTGSLTSSGS